MDSLSYCICDASDELLLHKQLDFDRSNKHTSLARHLETAWSSEANLSLPYDSVQIYFAGAHYTLIPTRLYSAADKAQYLLPIKGAAVVAESILANEVEAIDAYLIYAVPTAVATFITDTYGDKVAVKHIFSALIPAFLRQVGNGKEVFVNVRDYVVQTFFFDNKELIFSNQFAFQSEKDFLYYVLLVYDKFQLNQMEVPLRISGALSEDSAIYSQLYKYIQKLSFVDLPSNFSTSTELQQYPAHRFFDVLHAR